MDAATNDGRIPRYSLPNLWQNKTFVLGTNANATSYAISAKYTGSIPKNTDPGKLISPPRNRSEAA